MIRLTGVTVARGARVMAEGLDAAIGPGRIFWILGPNGAGKTSVLRVMVGRDPPRSGRVAWEPDHARPAYFPGEVTLPSGSTVDDWRRLAASLAGRPPTALWPAVAGGRAVGRLSTGERKRLLLDVVLRKPGPVVLDEPFEHLSPDAKAGLLALLEDRARLHPVVVATNQGTRRALRDGGVYLEDGRWRRLASAGVET